MLAFVAEFSVESSHANISSDDNRGLILAPILVSLFLGAMMLRALFVGIVWYFSRNKADVNLENKTVSPLSRRLSRLCSALQGFLIGIALIYPNMPIARGGAHSLLILSILSTLPWILAWVANRVPHVIGKTFTAYLRGIALTPLFLIGASAWTTWHVSKEAERLAGARPYCIGVPDQQSEYRPPTSLIDLMTIGFTPYPFDSYTYHGAILLGGNGTARWGNWSYSQLSFDLDHDSNDQSIPVPRFSCPMTTSYIARLRWF